MFDEASTMSMIADEVRKFAERKGWKWQVRRDWAVREKPVRESNIYDYEWKLIPDQVFVQTGPTAGSVSLYKREQGIEGEHSPEGWYYVLRLRDQRTLELSHGNDWSPGDGFGGWWSSQHTCTTIHLSAVRRLLDTESVLRSEWEAPIALDVHNLSEAQQGRRFRLDRLRDPGARMHATIALSNWLMIMTDRYQPNWFCAT